MCLYHSLWIGLEETGAPENVTVDLVLHVAAQLGGEAAVQEEDVWGLRAVFCDWWCHVGFLKKMIC